MKNSVDREYFEKYGNLKITYRVQKKQPWKGKYDAGHYCIPCSNSFFIKVKLPKSHTTKHYYPKGWTEGSRWCDSCLKYAIDNKMIVDWELV